MSEVTIVYGGPGAGKTHELLRIMEDELKQTEPNRIAFCSFTRQASYGARDRAIAQFGGGEDEYPYFRTLHSLAYRELSLTEGSIMQPANYAEIADALNLQQGARTNMYDGPIMGRPSASKLLSMCELARNRAVPLENVWREMRNPDLGWHTVKRYWETLKAYKRDTGLLDFTDVLETYLQEGLSLPVEAALIDEAQDLTPLQWRVVARAFANVPRLYVAGDDDQAIFRWAGATVEIFQAMKGTVRVLDKCHRLPAALFTAGQRVARRITGRTPKQWTYTREGGGIHWHRRIEAVPNMESGSWLLLARNAYFLNQYADLATRRGIYFKYRHEGNSVGTRDVKRITAYERLRAGRPVEPDDARAVLTALGRKPGYLDPEADGYTADDLGIEQPMPIWHEAFTKIPQRHRVYIIECLRRGERLNREPRVRIDTIHGAKGAEADNVVLMTDMTTRTKAGARRNPDDEWRCLYVGMTRASQHLHMITPGTINHYEIRGLMQ